MVEQFWKNCSLWERLTLERFVKDCVLWEGSHAGARKGVLQPRRSSQNILGKKQSKDSSSAPLPRYELEYIASFNVRLTAQQHRNCVPGSRIFLCPIEQSYLKLLPVSFPSWTSTKSVLFQNLGFLKQWKPFVLICTFRVIQQYFIFEPSILMYELSYWQT